MNRWMEGAILIGEPQDWEHPYKCEDWYLLQTSDYLKLVLTGQAYD
jgi:hypothetical protein